MNSSFDYIESINWDTINWSPDMRECIEHARFVFARLRAIRIKPKHRVALNYLAHDTNETIAYMFRPERELTLGYLINSINSEIELIIQILKDYRETVGQI
jgi:hypothetical protein